jgi:hypothetical protein
LASNIFERAAAAAATWKNNYSALIAFGFTTTQDASTSLNTSKVFGKLLAAYFEGGLKTIF